MKQFKKIISILLVSLLVFGASAIAFASTSEAEDNGTAATATAFETEISGSLASVDDVDYYKTTVAAAGIAKVKFISTSASAEYKVEVLDKDEKTITTFNVAAGAGTTTSSEFSVSADDYYVKVTAGTVSGTETYSVSISVEKKTNTEAEPNDTTGTATEIPKSAIGTDLNSSTKYSGAISAGDVDYFKAAILNPEGYFVVKFYNTENSAFKVSVIQNSTDKVVAELNVTETDSEVVSADIGVNNGTYFIKVEGADSTKTGGYSLKVYSKLAADCEIEYNGDKDNATVIAQGTKTYAAISLRSDVDFYKVTSKKDTKITVSVTNDQRNDSSVTWTAMLYNSGNMAAPIKTVTVSKAQSAEFDLREYDEGVYYIVVKAGENYSEGNYTVTSEAVKIEETSNPSWIDRIKALDWGSFWNDNFAPLWSNIQVWETLAALFKLSFGTILGWLFKNTTA